MALDLTLNTWTNKSFKKFAERSDKMETLIDCMITVLTVAVIVLVYMVLLIAVSIFGEKYIRVESLYYTFKTLMWMFLTVAFGFPASQVILDFIMRH